MPCQSDEALAKFQREQISNQVRIAMLGAGFIAEVCSQVYARLQGGEVVSVLGRDPARTKKFAEANGIGFAATSFEGLLDGPDFEAVDLCLPNHLHMEMAIAAAKAGKHILCEKALAVHLMKQRRCSMRRRPRGSFTAMAKTSCFRQI